MVVFSNHRLGPSAELLVPDEKAAVILRSVAAAAKPCARARWEHELVRWLEDRAQRSGTIDVSDIAWTPDHFEPQRRFLIEAIDAVKSSQEDQIVLQRWARMIEAYPRDSVRLGRLWQFAPIA